MADNKFKEFARKIYEFQATNTQLPPNQYVLLHEIMHDLRSIQPLDLNEIHDLVKSIDTINASPGEMVLKLLRLVEQKHGIE